MKYPIYIFLLFLSFNLFSSEAKLGQKLVDAVCKNNLKEVKTVKKIITINNIDLDVNNLVDEKNNSLLTRAVLSEYIDIFEELLAFPNINVNKRNFQGRSTLDFAYSKYSDQNNRFYSFSKFESAPNAIFIKALEVALTYEEVNLDKEVLFGAYQKRDLRVVNLLLSHSSVNPNVKNSNGDLFLIRVYNDYSFTMNDDFEFIMKLIGHKDIDINATGSDNETILHKVCYNESPVLDRKENYKLLEKIISDPQVDINYVNDYGKTALHKAVFLASCADEFGDNEKYEAQLDIIKLLLVQPNINLELVDDYGKTAYDLAAEKNCQPIMNILVHHNAEITYNSEEYTSIIKQNSIKQEIINCINNFEELSLEYEVFFNQKRLDKKREILEAVRDNDARDEFLSNLFIKLNKQNIQNQSKKLGSRLRHVIELGVKFSKNNFYKDLFRVTTKQEKLYYKRLIKFIMHNGDAESLRNFFTEKMMQKLEKKDERFAYSIEEYLSSSI